LGTVVWPQWFAGLPATIARNYHSVALLLRDGRIWTAGGNVNAQGSDCNADNQCDLACGDGQPARRQLAIEIFDPWYYGRSDRPTIITCPAQMGANGGGQYIALGSSDGQSIQKVALMRAGSVTHSFDTDQRLIWLDITSKTASTVNFNAPYNPAVAPKGSYMLFVLSNKLGASSPQLPSIGCWTSMV
jgi:hypothetical protein